MSRYEGLVEARVLDYILQTSVREPEILERLRKETSHHPMSRFQIPPEQGQLFRLLVRMTGARRVIEIGVFTGYSSLAMALALPDDGRIVAIDISDEYTQTARRYWQEGGVAGKVDLRLGEGHDMLDRMIASGESVNYDLAFVDADKTGYAGYYERCLRLLRPGGVIALDNMLSRGRVLEPDAGDADVAALQKMNEFIHRDDRVDALLLPLGDGLTLAVKR
jgi:predicted O-methyltransferase YrrM